MVLLPLFAAAALAQTGSPPPAAVRAEAVARATIVSPARLTVAADLRSARIDTAGTPGATPRRTIRPCDAMATSRNCLTMVFDLP